MKQNLYDLWSKKDYHYPVSGNFIPNLFSYIHEDEDKVYPAVIVVPGGGYNVVSPTEGEVVALEFYKHGYNAFVLTYTTNPFNDVPLELQPLKDLSAAVTFIRKHSKNFSINPHQIVVCGFSAGAHLTASLAVHYNLVNLNEEKVSNRPDAVVLSYPVITSGKYAHKSSFKALFGNTPKQEQLDFMSLEKHVTPDTPPAFIWQTVTDELVPIENSMLFAEAYQKNKVTYEYHAFSEGKHGLSLATKKMRNLPQESDYTMQQLYEEISWRFKNNFDLPPSLKEILSNGNLEEIKLIFRQLMNEKTNQMIPNDSIATWFELSQHFLTSVLDKNSKSK